MDVPVASFSDIDDGIRSATGSSDGIGPLTPHLSHRIHHRAYWARQWLLDQVVDLVAVPLRHAGPRSTAQARFHGFARLMAKGLRPIMAPRPRHYPSFEATIVNRLVTRFSRSEPGFPLLFELQGADHLAAAERQGKGVIIATVHTQLALSSHAALRTAGRSPLVVCHCKDRDISGWNWGHADPLDAIEARDPLLFRKLARHLADGRRILSFVDHNPASQPGDSMRISPNLFAWADRASIPIVFMLAQLDARGRIVIALHHEPAGSAAQSIDGFIGFVEQAGGWRCEPLRRRSADVDASRPTASSSDHGVAIAA
jgi:hypothetical protein